MAYAQLLRNAISAMLILPVFDLLLNYAVELTNRIFKYTVIIIFEINYAGTYFSLDFSIYYFTFSSQ